MNQMEEQPRIHDVDRNSGLYFQIGLAVALLLTIGLMYLDFTAPEGDIILTENPPFMDEQFVNVVEPLAIEVPVQVATTPDIIQIEPEKPKDPEPKVTPPTEPQDGNKDGEGEGTPGGSSDTASVFSEWEVDRIPMLMGRRDGHILYIKKYFNYPEFEKAMKREGRVEVSVVVGSDGQLRDIKLIRGLTPNMNAELLRVIREMPAWQPGMRHGKPIKVRLTIPVDFRLTQ